MERINQHIESLIFAAEKAITLKEIKASIEKAFELKFETTALNTAIQQLIAKYAEDDFAFEIVEINQGYQFMTKGAYHHTVSAFLQIANKKKLSKSALETLSIIAYKQPVTRVEGDSIRGVNSDYAVQKLLEKELVEIQGRSDAPGRPLIYKTGDKFMDYFGLKSLNDLPKLKDFKETDNQIGEPAPIVENIEGSNE